MFPSCRQTGGGGTGSEPGTAPPEGADQLCGQGGVGAGPNQEAAGDPGPSGPSGPGRGPRRWSVQRRRAAEEETPPRGDASLEGPGLQDERWRRLYDLFTCFDDMWVELIPTSVCLSPDVLVLLMSDILVFLQEKDQKFTFASLVSLTWSQLHLLVSLHPSFIFSTIMSLLIKLLAK